MPCVCLFGVGILRYGAGIAPIFPKNEPDKKFKIQFFAPLVFFVFTKNDFKIFFKTTKKFRIINSFFSKMVLLFFSKIRGLGAPKNFSKSKNATFDFEEKTVFGPPNTMLAKGVRKKFVCPYPTLFKQL